MFWLLSVVKLLHDRHEENGMLADCRKCGGVVAADSRTCPHCGAQNPGLSNAAIAVIAVMVLLVAIFIFLQLRPW